MVGSANLNIMIKAARRAGRALSKDFLEVENLQVSMKSAGDFVSKADINAEHMLREDLQGVRPTYGWLGEELGEEPGKDPTRRWIVDPLDGTANFLHGLPHWAISIALEHKGEIAAGVIYDPSKDEMFFAEKGQGAWLNEGRLRVSNRDKMIESVFACGLPTGGRGGLPETLQDLARMLPVTAGVRRWGAAALDIAYVAAGRYEGYWERDLSPWDMAAGVIIAREAGALVETVSGSGTLLHEDGILVANGTIFDRFSSIIRDQK